jgi:hypothetical protein
MNRILTLGLMASALLLAAVALVTVRPAALAAAVPEARQAQGPIRVQVNLVSLFATVRDKKTKRVINTLEQDDFKVT